MVRNQAMRVFVCAEAGVNHNGSVEMALRLVEAAAHAGADAVKFQTFRAEALAAPGAPRAEYQKARIGGEGDQLSMLRALELAPSAHRILHRRCQDLGIEFLSTAFDTDSADFLIQLGVRRIKIPSGELTNRPFIEYLASHNLPTILSTGMATLDEVAEAVEWIKAVRLKHAFPHPLSDYLTVLHCTSNYPAAMEDVNLRALQTLAQHFQLPVGYSDHTAGILMAPLAVALGATIIEKHFTLDRTLPGPDHAASLEPDELTELIANVRTAERALGNGIKSPCLSELPVRDLVRRSLALVRAVSQGRTLVAEDLGALRPGTGIPPAAFTQVVGRRVRQDFQAGHLLRWDDLDS